VSAEYSSGLLAAVGAAVLYGGAPVAQAVSARTTETGRGVGAGLTVRLARRPLWLVGFAAELGGFVVEAFAFSAAPATLVAPVAALDLVVFVLLGSLVFGTRWSRYGVAGAGAMTGGVVVLALALRSEGLGRPAGTAELIGLALGCAVAGGALALAGDRALRAGRAALATAAFALGSGIAYSVATLSTRQIGRTFTADEPWQLLTTPTPYVLGVASVLAITLMQRGLQTGALLTYPIVSASSAFVPVAVGVIVLGDPMPAGGARIAFMAALVLIAAGLGLLAHDRSAAEAGTARTAPAAGTPRT
jgi:drug/metabolite transporter (DMT)-like permease